MTKSSKEIVENLRRLGKNVVRLRSRKEDRIATLCEEAADMIEELEDKLFEMSIQLDIVADRDVN